MSNKRSSCGFDNERHAKISGSAEITEFMDEINTEEKIEKNIEEKMQNKAKTNANQVICIGIVLLLAAFIGLVGVSNLFHYTYRMNADIGAEAVLARLIWQSKEIIPSSWYASSETRIIATPQLAALFYGLTGNMNLSMGLACTSMMLLIAGMIWYFVKKTPLGGWCGAGMAALCLVLPMNESILEVLWLYAGYYATHLIAFFLTLHVYHELVSSRANMTQKHTVIAPGERNAGEKRFYREQAFLYSKLIVTAMLAFLLGMQGTRAILITYGPLFGIECIRFLYRRWKREPFTKKNLKAMLYVCALLILSFLGTKTPFASGQDVSRNLRKGFSKLVTSVLPDTATAIGFRQGALVQNVCLFILVLTVLITVWQMLLRMIRKKELAAISWCFLVTAASPIVAAVMVAFTTVESTPRYYFMWVFSMAFAAVLQMEHMIRGLHGEEAGIWKAAEKQKEADDREEAKKQAKAGKRQETGSTYDYGKYDIRDARMIVCMIMIAVFILAILNIRNIYLPILTSEEPPASDAAQVTAYLEVHHYTNAYTDFDHANAMTSLANGRVNVYAVNSFADMDICKWLTDRNGYTDGYAVRPDGEPTVYIVPEERQEEFEGFLQSALCISHGGCTEEEQIGGYHIWVMQG